MGAPQFTPDLSTDLVSRSERRHPGAGFLDERSRSDDAHSRTRAKVPDVVRDEETRSGANRRGEDWDVLRISELPRTFTVVRRRLMDLDGNRAKEFLEERGSLGELGNEVPSDFRHRRLGKDQTQKVNFAEHQNRMAGARA